MELLGLPYRGPLWVSTAEARQGTKQGNHGGGRERRIPWVPSSPGGRGGSFDLGPERGRRDK